MEDELNPTNIRFPKTLHNQLKNISSGRGISLSKVVIEACEQYVNNPRPGLCSNCGTQNSLDADYCKKCIQPLSHEAKSNFKSTEEYIQNTPELQQMMMKIVESINKRNNS